MTKKKKEDLAQWIRVTIGSEEYFMCSACDMKWVLAAGTPIQNEMFYCPRCGHKMKEEIV